MDEFLPMSDLADKALLPAGMCDVLPPDAAFEADVVERLMVSFAGHGYERVKPPLIEFEQSLLAGSGAAMANQTFRLMDPVSQRMMGLRPDMTLQVARIAATRLNKWPRPLRLGYAGQVLRVRGSQLRPERQFGQVGAELIGASTPNADAEVILIAVEALTALGVGEMSVDLGLPTLVPAVVAALGLDTESAARLRTALDRKDAAEVAAMGDRLGADAGKTLLAMLAAAGPAEDTLEVLNRLALPEPAARERATLAAVVERVRAGAPDLNLTVDPVESRGFEYHTGVTFTLFAPNLRGELGGGGRYLADGGDGAGEPATGLTLFMDTVLRALPRPAPPRRVLLPAGTPAAEGRKLRKDGWVTVEAMEAAADAAAEAERMGCGHLLEDGKLRALEQKRGG